MDEREALFRERRLHKETAVFLHEWAHTLGAFHDRTVDWLMSRTYDEHQALFSESTVGLLRGGARPPRPRRRRRAQGVGGGVPRARSDAAVVRVARAVQGGGAGDVARVLDGQGGPAQARLGEADRFRFNEVIRLFNRGSSTRRSCICRRSFSGHPQHADIQHLGSPWRTGARRKEAPTLARCAQAASLPDARAPALLVLAHARVDGGDAPGARADLARAQAKLEGGEGDAQSWRYLAGLGAAGAGAGGGGVRVQRVPMHEDALALSEWGVAAAAAVDRGAARRSRDEPGAGVGRHRRALAAEVGAEGEAGGRAVAQRDLLHQGFKDAAATSLVDGMLALMGAGTRSARLRDDGGERFRRRSRRCTRWGRSS